MERFYLAIPQQGWIRRFWPSQSNARTCIQASEESEPGKAYCLVCRRIASLFPAPGRQRELVIQDMQGTATGVEDLEILEKVGSCVDRLIQAAAKEALQGDNESQVYQKLVAVGRGRQLMELSRVSKESDIT